MVVYWLKLAIIASSVVELLGLATLIDGVVAGRWSHWSFNSRFLRKDIRAHWWLPRLSHCHILMQLYFSNFRHSILSLLLIILLQQLSFISNRLRVLRCGWNHLLIIEHLWVNEIVLVQVLQKLAFVIAY